MLNILEETEDLSASPQGELTIERESKVNEEGQDATIFCPSASAYGKRGAGKLIPPYTTLVFDVSLLKVD